MFDQPIALDDVSDFNPEWMIQRRLIGEGKASWDDFSFYERTCKGWLLPLLWQIDSLISGRWWYWTRTLENGAPLDEPIPRIDFLDFPTPEAINNLKECLGKYNLYDFSLSDFLGWLLWGFGATVERAKISDEANEFLYRTFNLGLLLQYPHDYFGHILSEAKAGYWNNPNAFYPTPHSVCNAMCEMTFSDAIREGKDLKSKKVADPCVGTGRMLMYASNYSLFLYAQDIDRVCCMACHVNGYLYMPWLVRSGLPAPVDPKVNAEPVACTVESIDVPNRAPVNISLQPDSKNSARPTKPHQLSLF